VAIALEGYHVYQKKNVRIAGFVQVTEWLGFTLNQLEIFGGNMTLHLWPDKTSDEPARLLSRPFGSIGH